MVFQENTNHLVQSVDHPKLQLVETIHPGLEIPERLGLADLGIHLGFATPAERLVGDFLERNAKVCHHEIPTHWSSLHNKLYELAHAIARLPYDHEFVSFSSTLHSDQPQNFQDEDLIFGAKRGEWLHHCLQAETFFSLWYASQDFGEIFHIPNLNHRPCYARMLSHRW